MDSHRQVMQRCLAVAALATALQLALMLKPGLPTVGSPDTSFVTLHLLLELFAVCIAALIAVVSWHTYGLRPEPAGNVAVGGFVVVAACDLVHALTYDGMPAFFGAGSTERAIFFWLMGRFFEVLTLGLMATRLAPQFTRASSLGLGALLAALVFAWGTWYLDWFPTTFIPGTGFTPFKAGFEVLLCIASFAVAAWWWRLGQRHGDVRHFLIATACWVIGVGELAFTSYRQPSDFQNVFGHLYKIAGYSLLYAASFISNVRMPFTAMREAVARAEDSEQRLRALSDNLPHTVVYRLIVEPQGAFRYAHISDAIERTLGLKARDVMEDPMRLRRCIHEADAPIYKAAARAAVKQMTVMDVTVRFRHVDGRVRWVRMVSAPHPQDEGRVAWDGLAIDVTESRTAELQHRENEAMLAAVIRSASDAVISTDGGGRITLFNPAAERIFGHPATTLLGQGLERLLPAAEAARHEPALHAFAESGVTSRRMGPGRVKGRRADGTELELEASISQVTVNDRKVLTAILRDVTERVRTERALVRSQVELTELTHRLMAQEKDTTSRLAQVLHDQLGQTLTAMRIDFVSEAALPDPGQAARHARVDRLIDQAVREVRQVLVELRPTLLEEHGLVEALHNELETRQRGVDKLQLHLDALPSVTTQRWNPDVEYAAFMVVREAVANAVQHAQASQVRVRVDGSARELRVEVQDDGVGLGEGATVNRPGHLGMVGMRERSIAIGARFELRSTPQLGTSVILSWEEPNP